MVWLNKSNLLSIKAKATLPYMILKAKQIIQKFTKRLQTRFLTFAVHIVYIIQNAFFE